MTQVHTPLFLPDPEATDTLARSLAPCLGVGDVLLLDGQIGAGKTHFARALIRALLDRDEDVPSPTFTLIQTYDAPGFEIWHADLYRLGHPDELCELGLDEAFETAICLIEWPDRLAGLAPADALWLSFAPSTDGEGRIVTLKGDAARWSKLAPAFQGARA